MIHGIRTPAFLNRRCREQIRRPPQHEPRTERPYPLNPFLLHNVGELMTAVHPDLRLCLYTLRSSCVDPPPSSTFGAGACPPELRLDLRCGKINRGSLEHRLPSATARTGGSRLRATSSSAADSRNFTTSSPAIFFASITLREATLNGSNNNHPNLYSATPPQSSLPADSPHTHGHLATTNNISGRMRGPPEVEQVSGDVSSLLREPKTIQLEAIHPSGGIETLERLAN